MGGLVRRENPLREPVRTELRRQLRLRERRRGLGHRFAMVRHVRGRTLPRKPSGLFHRRRLRRQGRVRTAHSRPNQRILRGNVKTQNKTKHKVIHAVWFIVIYIYWWKKRNDLRQDLFDVIKTTRSLPFHRRPKSKCSDEE